MKYENITVQDCINLHEDKNKAAIINDGKVIGFVCIEKRKYIRRLLNMAGIEAHAK